MGPTYLVLVFGGDWAPSIDYAALLYEGTDESEAESTAELARLDYQHNHKKPWRIITTTVRAEARVS